jgi:chromosome segregation ATPase
MDERKRLMKTWASALSQPEYQPESYECLFDCVCFFHMLRLSAPSLFPEEDALTPHTEGNWVVRKENAATLAVAMNRFALEGLQAREDFDVRTLVDILALAKGSDEALLQLGDLVITFAVLSFTPEKKQTMSKLSQDDQKAISQNVRRCIALYSLKAYKRAPVGAAPAASPVSAAPLAASSDHSEGKPSLSSTKVLQDEIASLQRELAEKANTICTLEGRLAFVETEKMDVTAKYNTLLAEHDAQSRQHTTEQELFQQLAKKDATIRDLHASLDEASEKLNLQKQRVAALEVDADKLKGRLKDATVQLKTATSERYDKEQDLKVLQDRFELAGKVRKELEEKNDSLASEVAILRAKIETASATQHGDDDDVHSGHNLSDVDMQTELIQALGRIRQLEAELAMLKRSGFGGVSGQHEANQSSFLGEDTSRYTEEASVIIADASKVAALEEELTKERTATQAAVKEKETMANHLQHALSQLGDHKEMVQELAQENMKLKQQTVDFAATEAAVREAEALRSTLKAQQTRFEERRDMANREKAVLVSTMVRYGHRNLLLQQRELLASSATVTQQQQQSAAGGGTLGLVVGLFTGGSTTDAAEVPGSFLTKHRRVLERGLLDSACSMSRK